MYQLYVIDKSAFDPKKLIGEFVDLDVAHTRLQKEFDKNPETKYIIEETSGHFNSYGDLLAEVIEKN